MALEDEFGDIIRKARIGQELDLVEAASRVSLPQDRLAALESYQTTPTPLEVERLATLLGLHAGKLAGSAFARWYPTEPAESLDRLRIVSLEVRQVDGWRSNCHIVGFEGEEEAVVVDPGADPERILGELERLGWAPRYVALTHGHWDHIGGVPAVIDEWGVLVLAGEGDRAMLPDLNGRLHVVHDGECLPLGSYQIKALGTPGHTAGGISYLVGSACFTGDALFAGSIGKANVPCTGYRSLLDSLRRRVLSLPTATGLYPGHGPNSTVGQEREHNPFF